ncbi:MAG TPA: UDP-N-acetylmuramoyl-tripeptide--D-alanyl-D-alanine ligase, partial [Candidatus Brocadiia bacterium]|nr:UDP-N-acetylmuramoyl-tripeptide--D-alanyl-D-alanine ligase [Candidatus Brocadiia bacterium]
MESFTLGQILGILGLPPQPGPATPITSVTTDSRAAGPGSLFIAIAGQRHDGHDFVASALRAGAEAAIVSRDVILPAGLTGRPLLKVPDTIAAYGRIAAWRRRQWAGPLIALTGSNGKTTTREMLAHLLSPSYNLLRSPKSFNNNIGVPHTLLQLAPQHNLAIIELGASAPGEIAPLAAIAQPDLGLITNIGESHLEKLGSLEGVAAEKGALLQALPPGGHAFLNADDPMTPLLASLRPNGPATTFGRSDSADVRCVREERSPGGNRFWLADGRECRLPVPGRHNISNALAALAV